MNMKIYSKSDIYSWKEPELISVKEFIQTRIDHWLKTDLKKDVEKYINDVVDYKTESKIKNYGDSVKKDLENKINNMFNQTTRNALGETLFKILTENETYKQLRKSMDNLLENK